MRIGENIIYGAGEPQEFDLEAAQRAVFCLPGRLCVAPDKARTTYGSIVLPDTAAQAERPDCGTIVSVGGPRTRQSGEVDQDMPVHPGERVLLRPCKGKWLRDFQSSDGSFGLPEIRFYGVTYDWQHEILAVYRGDSWQPLNDWLIVQRESNEEQGGIFIANPDNKAKRHRAKVLNCQPGYGILPGQIVLIDNHPNVGLAFTYGEFTGCEFVKCVDEDSYRQVWAIVDEAAA